MADDTQRKLRYIDIGANLTDGMYKGTYNGKDYHDPDLDVVLERAWAAGLQKIIITAGTLSEAQAALDQARTDPRLHCTVGVHPTRCDEFDTHPQGPDAYMDELRKVIKDGVQDGKVVAIGECGLDYDRVQFCSKEVQNKHFAAQFALAKEFGLPMFLHMRAAADDFIKILSAELASFSSGVVHSFDGSLEDASRMLALHPRLFIGINGCSLKTADNCDTMAAIPLPRLMIETDAPWCDCRPTHASAVHVESKVTAKDRKKYEKGCLVKGRNEPCNIVQVLEAVAGHRGLRNKYAVAETIYRITESVFFPDLGQAT